MSNEVTVTVKGWVGNNATLHVGPNGGRMTSFRLGVTPRYFSRAAGEHRDAPTQWFTVKSWGELGENVAECVRKGIPVIVRGRLVTETWQSREGAERFANVIHAESVGVELGKGIVEYTRVSRNSSEADDEERYGNAVADEPRVREGAPGTPPGAPAPAVSAGSAAARGAGGFAASDPWDVPVDDELYAGAPDGEPEEAEEALEPAG